MAESTKNEVLARIAESLRTRGDCMRSDLEELEMDTLYDTLNNKQMKFQLQKYSIVPYWKLLYPPMQCNLLTLLNGSELPRAASHAEPLQVDSLKKNELARIAEILRTRGDCMRSELEELEMDTLYDTLNNKQMKFQLQKYSIVPYWKLLYPPMQCNLLTLLNGSELPRAASHAEPLQVDSLKKRTQSTCKSCADVKDSTEWELVVPDAVASSVNENVKYRFTAAAGSYECTVTGLRWESSSEVELEYCWSNWELVSEVLEREQYHPGGPLLDVAVIRGTLDAVHLPHFLCLGSESSLSDAVRVFHDEDVGASFETCSLSRFHAKLLQPTFSPKGVLVKNGFRVKAHCEILIYHVLAAPLTLHIYVIPHDIKIKEAVEKERSDKCVKILKPNPKSSLQMKSWYKLKTLQKTKQSNYDSEITPTSLKLRYNTATTNFFEVYISNPEEDFYLQLTTEKNNEVVWEVPIRGNDFSVVSGSLYEHKDRSSSHAVCFVDKYMKELIQRVTLVSPIADDLKLLIGNEKYSVIRGCSTPQEKMRTLYTFLAAGQELKVKFYESLQKNEPLIVEELQRQESS